MTEVATVRAPVASGVPAPWPKVWAVVTLFATYYLGAKLGLALTPASTPVSTLWPPNAILLGALLLARPRVWPLLFAAGLAAHLAGELQGGVPLPMVLSWYVSNCSEALIGAICIRQLIGTPVRLDTVRRAGIFVLMGAVLAPMLSGFLDAAFVEWNAWGSDTYWEIWRNRFFSNVLAILAIVPVAVTWGSKSLRSFNTMRAGRVLEGIILVTMLTLVCVKVFGEPAVGAATHPVVILAPMPFLLWAAVRFGPAGSSLCLLVFSILSIWGALHGHGPFDRPMEQEVLPLQLFLILTYIPILGLTAMIRERARAFEEARSSERQLNLALSAAQMATWELDLTSKRWPEKLNEVLGLDRNGTGVLQGADPVAPSERALVRTAILQAIENGTPYEAEFRITRSDGSTQWVLGKGTVVQGHNGRPVRMIGVNADITERKRAETVLRDEAMLRQSESRFRELADAMPQVVFTARPDGEIDYVNRKWVDLTGLSSDLHHNRLLLRIIHPEDRANAASAWRASVIAGVPYEYQGRFWSVRSATFRWHLVRALPVRNETGRIVRWYGTATDIDDHKRVEQALRHTQVRLRAFQRGLEHRVKERTAELSLANGSLREEVHGRVRTEQALRASEERFAKAFRAMPDAIAIARRPEGQLIEINERWETMFGCSRAETISRSVDDIRIFADILDRQRFFTLMESQGFVRELECDLRDMGGGALKGVLAAETVDVGGEACFILMIRDVTDRRRAEMEVEMQRRQLAHLGRVALLGELSGALAHELNQPLAAILANARAARRMLDPGRFDPAELRSILDDIVADDRRAGDVIRRVRALIRRDETEMQPVMLNDVVNDVLDLAHSDLIERGVAVRTVLSKQMPEVMGDRVQLQQVVLNLIVNACDAMSDTPLGDRLLTIATANEGEVLHVSVSDNGTGIKSDEVDAVFEPFVTSKEHGLGLGLTICRSIVDAHGGRLWAVNNDERGATFHLVLPQYTPGSEGDNGTAATTDEILSSAASHRA